jgi:hypothetical protein
MNFYSIASIIALVILIICLIGIGILMQYQNAGITFPLHPNKCPDLWTFDATQNKCVSNANKNVGKLPPSTPVDPLTSSKATCDKYIWTRQNGINWDGVSNFNGCS